MLWLKYSSYDETGTWLSDDSALEDGCAVDSDCGDGALLLLEVAFLPGAALLEQAASARMVIAMMSARIFLVADFKVI